MGGDMKSPSTLKSRTISLPLPAVTLPIPLSRQPISTLLQVVVMLVYQDSAVNCGMTLHRLGAVSTILSISNSNDPV